MNKTCPFCIPNVNASVFAQSENFKAVYNIAPILPGHSLIICNKHISRFMQLEDSVLSEMMVFSRQVICTLSKAFKTDSFNWTLQEGTDAGQTVEHMHIHIIPRRKGDLNTPGDWYPELKKQEAHMLDSFSRPKLNNSEMQSIITYLKKVHSKQ